MSIHLKFLTNEANEDEGLGNAGIEFFRDEPYAGTAREIGQNSRDAFAALPVKITFDVMNVSTREIPDFKSLQEAVAACLSKARTAGDQKEMEFFEQARRVVTQDPIKVLRISDSNTTGLRGPDESGTPFHSLVKGSGVSKKQNDASGGSFGIGKNAVYAISDLQTVFYSTLYAAENGTQQFLAQGKSILVSHKGSNGRAHRAMGYWGLAEFSPIADPEQAPAWMRRQDQGTSVFALGFRETRDWQHRIAYSLLQNFFCAIYKGEMEFSIDNNKIVISKANVGALFSDQSIATAAEQNDRSEAYQTSKEMFRCLTSLDAKEHELNIDGLGRVMIRVLVEDGLPKKVNIVRNGMVITDNLEHFGDKFARFQMQRDFVALVMPLDSEGSTFIKKLENPKHDSLSGDRLPDEAKRASAKRVMKKLAQAIRDTIKQHTLTQFADEISADELKKYFSVQSDAQRLGADNGDHDPETIRYSIEPKPDRHPPQAAAAGKGNAGGIRKGFTQSPTPGPGLREDPQPRPSGAGGTGRSRAIQLSGIRNFVPTGGNATTRAIMFTPSESGQAVLSVEATGLNESEVLQISKVNGAKVRSGKILLSVTANQRTRVEVEFGEPYAGPIEVHASLQSEETPHEAE